jgi:PAS domain S-box-containing protein
MTPTNSEEISELRNKIKMLEEQNRELLERVNPHSVEGDFSLILDNLNDLVVKVDLEGKFVFVSPSYCRVFDMEEKDLIGKKFIPLVHEDDQAETLEAMQNLLSPPHTCRLVQRAMTKKGWRWLEWVDTAILGNDGSIREIIGVGRDITDRVLAEEALHLSKERYELALLAVNDGIWDWDVLPNKVYFDPRYYTIAGYEPDEFPHDFVEWQKRVHPDDLERSMEQIHAHLDGKTQVFDIEFRFLRKDGSWMWLRGRGKKIKVDQQGKVLRMIGTHTDISDRKEAEDKYRLLATILERSQDFIGVANLDQVPLYVNPAGKKLMGIKSDQEVTNLRILDFFMPDDLPFVEKVILPALDKEGRWSGEFRFRHFKSGEPVDVYYDLFKTEDPTTGKPTNLSTISRNISDLKKAQNELILKNQEYETLNEELRQTNEQLFIAKERAEESDRLKTAFLQNMSHEIRTPMNAIIGFSSFLLDPALDISKRQYYSRIISDSSLQLLNVLNDILTIASLESNQEKIMEETFNLNLLFDEVIGSCKEGNQKKRISYHFETCLPDPAAHILADRIKTREVLLNLLSNATKFSKEGTIEAGYEKVEEKQGTFLRCFVRDRGAGIHPGHMERVFDRFFQANPDVDSTYRGAGLGLAICKGFVELMGGKIWVESTLGKGSTFYFTLPYKPVIVEEPTLAALGVQQGESRVLVAEDEEFNFLFLKEVLETYSCTITRAENGEEAISLFMENPGLNLVLMDIKMPRMDGYSAAKIIKKTDPAIPVVALSAYAIEQEKQRYRDVFDEYITKPIDIRLLKKVLSRYLAEKI